MRISLIAAMAENRVIGCNNRLPWHLPEDLLRFRQLTWGKTVVMGRKTYESIGKALPGRDNWVVSASLRHAPGGCQLAASLEEILALPCTEIFIIGGQTLYEQCLPLAGRLYLTVVAAQPPGDVWFPVWPAGEWILHGQQTHPADARHAHAFTFQEWHHCARAACQCSNSLTATGFENK